MTTTATRPGRGTGGVGRVGVSGGTVRTPTPPPRGGGAAFLREFLRAPTKIGAIAPSSRHLAKAMVRGIDFGACRTVVEFGPGMGVFTGAIVDSLPAGWTEDPARKFFAIEFNERLASLLHDHYPQVRVLNDDATKAVEVLGRQGVAAGTVDCILSGLAWTNFSDEMRERGLQAVKAALKPGGEFRTFMYHCALVLPGAWHLRSLLKKTFDRVETSRIVWRNMPPAFVYRCVKN